MKRTISIFLSALMLFSSASISVLAANENKINNRKVSITIHDDEPLREVDAKLFGYSQEIYHSMTRRTQWLDKNYDKYQSFSNDFENEEYYSPAPVYAEAHRYPTSTKTTKYIANGDVYGGNASFTKYMVKSGEELFPGQYVNGVLQKPSVDLESTSSSKYSYINKDALVTGGLKGYVGFNTYFELGKHYSPYDIEDLTVIKDPANARNHVLKLSPAITSNSTGKDSFFGKDSLGIMDRKTTFTYKIKIDSEIADSRLGITKDWNMEQIKDKESEKYALAGALQFVKEYGTEQVLGWFDAIRFKDGKIYLGGTQVGTYKTKSWYDVSYTLDLKHDGYAYHTLKVVDDKGNTAVEITSPVNLNPSLNMGRDNAAIKGLCTDAFKFEERSCYGYLLTAHSDISTSYDNTVVYIDDLSFKTDKFYDDPDAIINEHISAYEDYAFPYIRLGGGTANTFKWKEALGDPKERNRVDRSGAVRLLRDVYGIPEWLKMVERLNPDAELAYCINMYDSNEDIIDLIEFMTAEGDINGDGVDWAEVRRANGIDKLPNLHMWEVGNEPDINPINPGVSDEVWDVESFLRRSAEIVELLLKYSPDHIKIGIPIETKSVNGDWQRRFLNIDLEEYEEPWPYTNDIDFLVVHTYNNLRVDMPYYISNSEMGIVQNIKRCSNPDIRIAYTEHNVNTSTNQSNHYTGIGLMSALELSTFFNKIMRDEYYYSANVHALAMYPGQFGTGWVEDDGSFGAGATLRLMDMYAKNAVGDVLDVSMTGFYTSPQTYTNWTYWSTSMDYWNSGTRAGYNASAVKHEDGSVNIIVCNQRNHTLNLEIKDLAGVLDGYALAEKTVITGNNASDTIRSFDGYSNVPNAAGVNELVYRKEMVYYTDYTPYSTESIPIDTYSITLLKFKKDVKEDVSAQHKGQQRLDITGRVGKFGNGRVNLYIEDAKTKEIKYIDETFIQDDLSYRFNFQFDGNIEDCRVLIRYSDITQDITDSFVVVNKPDKLFEAEYTVGDGKVTASINNKYNLLNIPCIMLVSGRNGGKVTDVSLSESVTLKNGINAVIADDVTTSSSRKVFVWENIKNLTPLLSEKYVK